jgi:2-polyprenyl-3-methyl-5-hydroxy-6-metoxy-1,4-benzoquinol methylase
MSENYETCAICSSGGPHNKLTVKEMMLGTRHQFDYFQCGQCGCIQILSVPGNLQDYYQTDEYYSFRSKSTFISRHISKLSFRQKGIQYKILKYFLMVDSNLRSVGRLGINPTSRILDVGSGSGGTLRALKMLGYSDVTGIDPYIEEDIETPVRVMKKRLQDLNQNTKFDLILYMHSLEHMSNPLRALSESAKLLNENGVILIRTPIISDAFEEYRQFWFQLDAPRHHFIFSTKALAMLFNKSNMKLVDSYYDSTDAQFTWSRRYKDNIAMNEASQSRLIYLSRRLFSKDVLRAKKT